METITTIALVLSAILPITLTIAIIAIMTRVRKLTKEARFKALQIEAELTAAKNELLVKTKELEADVKDTFRNVNKFLEKVPDDPEYKASLEAYVDACTETAHTIEKIGDRVSTFPLKKGITAFLEAVKEDDSKAADSKAAEEPVKNSYDEDYAVLMELCSDIDDLWTVDVHEKLVNDPETLRHAMETSEAIAKLRAMTDIDSDEPAIEDLAGAVYRAFTGVYYGHYLAKIDVSLLLSADMAKAESLFSKYVLNNVPIF